MKLTSTKIDQRTVLRDEDGAHVGTIIEFEAARKEKGRWRPGIYHWLSAHNSGYSDFFEDAEDAILCELER